MARVPSKDPEKAWEQMVRAAYYDHRWRNILEPLYEELSAWHEGELEHGDLDEVIHEAHKETQVLYRLFIQNKNRILHAAVSDREWFEEFVKLNPPPDGLQLADE